MDTYNKYFVELLNNREKIETDQSKTKDSKEPNQ
jgi:hypothetical protein